MVWALPQSHDLVIDHHSGHNMKGSSRSSRMPCTRFAIGAEFNSIKVPFSHSPGMASTRSLHRYEASVMNSLTNKSILFHRMEIDQITGLFVIYT